MEDSLLIRHPGGRGALRRPGCDDNPGVCPDVLCDVTAIVVFLEGQIYGYVAALRVELHEDV
ncbi:hypothetical protein D3C84_1200430 [compost metagenome]